MNGNQTQVREPASCERPTDTRTRPGPLAGLLLLPIRAYRKALGPLLAPSCRFYPSCSAYAVDALTRHGGLRGLYLIVLRLFKCAPWHPGGVDLVPQRFTFRVPWDSHEASAPRPDSSIQE